MQVRAALVQRAQAAAAEVAASSQAGDWGGTAQQLPLPEATGELAAELAALSGGCDSARTLQVRCLPYSLAGQGGRYHSSSGRKVGEQLNES